MTTLIAALVAALIPTIIGYFWARTWRRDRQYKAVPPGSIDKGGLEGRADDRAPVAVRFTPPEISAALVNYLDTGKIESRDMVALIMTWAVKGAVVLDVRTPEGASEDSKEREYWLRVTGGSAKLEGIEKGLYEVIMHGQGDEVLLGERNRSLKERMATGHEVLLKHAEQRQLFMHKPTTGLPIAFAAVITLVVILWLANFHVVALGLIAGGVAMALFTAAKGARSALGRALWDQSRGFELYLRTAEADQIAWEEANDIFSRYLPYAIAYGCADRWVKLFKDIADARGLELETPGWYAASLAGDMADAMVFSLMLSSLDLDLGGLMAGMGDWGDFADAGEGLAQIGESIGDAVSGFDIGDIFD